MNCKDCLHDGICEICDRQLTINEENVINCNDFKDKSHFIKLPCKANECLVSYRNRIYHAASIDFNDNRVNLNGSDIVPLEECTIQALKEREKKNADLTRKA